MGDLVKASREGLMVRISCLEYHAKLNRFSFHFNTKNARFCLQCSLALAANVGRLFLRLPGTCMTPTRESTSYCKESRVPSSVGNTSVISGVSDRVAYTDISFGDTVSDTVFYPSTNSTFMSFRYRKKPCQNWILDWV